MKTVSCEIYVSVCKNLNPHLLISFCLTISYLTKRNEDIYSFALHVIHEICVNIDVNIAFGCVHEGIKEFIF